MMGIAQYIAATLRTFGGRRQVDVVVNDGSGNPITTFGGSGGTASNFGSPFPGTGSPGTAAGFKDNSGNMSGGNLDASGNLKVNVAAGGAGGGAVTVADGADTAEGATTDAAVTTNTTGTLSGKLRGLVAILADVWNSGSHWLQVSIQNATLAVTQSGSWNLASSARSDTFTVTGNGVTVNVSTAPVKYFSIQVTGTGAGATSWTVVLEASLDGVNFTTIMTHSNTTDSNGSTAWTPQPVPASYFRSRVSALSLGSATNIVVQIVGMN